MPLNSRTVPEISFEKEDRKGGKMQVVSRRPRKERWQNESPQRTWMVKKVRNEEKEAEREGENVGGG